MSQAQPREPRSTSALSALTTDQRRTLQAFSRAVTRDSGTDFERFIARQTAIFTETAVLSDVLARQAEPLPTGVVSSLNDTELFWRRIEAEHGFLTSVEVSEALGARPTRAYASDLRKAGRVLGLRRTNRYVYPGFQFQAGSVRPVVPRLIALGAEHDLDSRDVVAWLYRPTTYLRDPAHRPVDHLDDPETVLDAAARAWAVAW
ncbi:hypothetical protein C5B94_15445 [Clavibacter michiganensis]|uniref:hypothetical protein n=1 Tax=Clavibacter michiganensis TaxID=28447 RepID=UPI000CE82FFE|nr:hypothetical protein [Clavibacter michiganensis]PPF50350.1 hypothetical protein C5B94_15445 [Clavibacter michiganensis]